METATPDPGTVAYVSKVRSGIRLIDLTRADCFQLDAADSNNMEGPCHQILFGARFQVEDLLHGRPPAPAVFQAADQELTQSLTDLDRALTAMLAADDLKRQADFAGALAREGVAYSEYERAIGDFVQGSVRVGL